MPAPPPLNLRSSTSNKRPIATGLSFGAIAINYHEDDPAIYFRGNANALIKAGSAFVGTTAPNATPASGGSSGNAKGETWLDTSGAVSLLKVWNGTAWTPAYAIPSGASLNSPSITTPTVTGGTFSGSTLISPALSGTPTAPTAASGTNTTQVATTAFVQSAVSTASQLLGGSVTTTTTGKTLSNNEFCTVLSSGLTITLPATPAAGSSVGVSIGGSFLNTVVGRNGQNIMGLAEDMTINQANVSVLFKFVDATRGWRMI